MRRARGCVAVIAQVGMIMTVLVKMIWAIGRPEIAQTSEQDFVGRI